MQLINFKPFINLKTEPGLIVDESPEAGHESEVISMDNEQSESLTNPIVADETSTDTSLPSESSQHPIQLPDLGEPAAALTDDGASTLGMLCICLSYYIIQMRGCVGQ